MCISTSVPIKVGEATGQLLDEELRKEKKAANRNDGDESADSDDSEEM